MDWHVVLARPAEEVFAFLADPFRLGEWMPSLTDSSGGAGGQAELGTIVTVTIDGPDGPQAATAELTAFEPPWLVGYRFFIGPQTLTLRMTCTAQGGQTRLHVRQVGAAAAPTLDFSQLAGRPPPPAASLPSPAEQFRTKQPRTEPSRTEQFGTEQFRTEQGECGT